MERPLAILFDLALEQFDKIVGVDPSLASLDINSDNLKRILPGCFDYMRLSDVAELRDAVGFGGLNLPDLPIPTQLFDRIVNRGSEFYQQFGWTPDQVLQRSWTVSCSEAVVGAYLRGNLPNSILIYTPSMLERAALYSGMAYRTAPLPYVVPLKGL